MSPRHRPRLFRRPPEAPPPPPAPGHWVAVFKTIARQAAFQVLRALPGAPPDYRLRKLVMRTPWKVLKHGIHQAGYAWPHHVHHTDWPLVRPGHKEES